MGANTFLNVVKRKNAKNAAEAFRNEAEQSRYESGRSYSGEIGMKYEYVVAKKGAKKCSTIAEACVEADRLVLLDDYDDKWGPAFCIEVEGDEGGWVFFGWASS